MLSHCCRRERVGSRGRGQVFTSLASMKGCAAEDHICTPEGARLDRQWQWSSPRIPWQQAPERSVHTYDMTGDISGCPVMGVGRFFHMSAPIMIHAEDCFNL